MKRKAIQLANQTLVVSLPSKWVKEQGIKKGDEIDIEETKNGLIISSNSSAKQKKETEINLINNSETTLGLLIGNLYWSGFDKIKINFNNFKEKQYELLKQKIKSRMIGFEITKIGEDYCIVEKIAEPSEEQFENVLRKLFLNIDELFEFTELELKKKKGNLGNYEEIEQRIFKYDNFCRRVIQKNRLQMKNYEMCLNFIACLWNSQREIYYLNKFLEGNKEFKLLEDFLDLIGYCRSFLKMIESSFFNKKVELLGKIHELEPDIINEKVYNLFKKGIKSENIVLFRLSSCIRQLHLTTCPLMGFILD